MDGLDLQSTVISVSNERNKENIPEKHKQPSKIALYANIYSSLTEAYERIDSNKIKYVVFAILYALAIVVCITGNYISIKYTLPAYLLLYSAVLLMMPICEDNESV
ncbi:uncharacterized protein NESG_01379 [Nematocida ausubeli]|uniref:Uncharacterized protein n=1 Tax=Nematocida ausubeli (strain ATCC PRA-371 / ERTm2) TaxID=1913371 RepID=A0A086J292_NEMA1|nr:uncharacterized protein NESG_01379 [Nematocida ausubeli]KAI5136303.1 hypothetical protein NEAUS07_1574 [Nematocida ausubeli]KFG26260.1 hypothetical protein NESG_01379 [Nematocida ausubeli]